MKRTLAETLTEVVDGLRPTVTGEPKIRVRSADLDLPIEVVLAHTTAGPVLLADLPRWRWTTDFDLPPGRLSVRFEERAPW